MFESGAKTFEVDDAAVAEGREADWRKLHEEIQSVGSQITALEAREVDLLLEAEETYLYKWLGFTSIYAYAEEVLHHSHNVATERIRVAHELLELPGIAAEFRAGAMPWRSVRELTRVVTTKTEPAWLEAVQGQRSETVQQMVRGKSKGDLPGDPVDPKKLTYRVVFQGVSPEVYMRHKQARIALAEMRDDATTDNDLLDAYTRGVVEPAVTETPTGPTPPRYQIGIKRCPACNIAHRVGAGIEVAISPAELEQASCDAEHIGDLDRDKVERLQATIPASTRRKVFMRDNYQCSVPGCRASRFLEVHHVVMRSAGGGNQLWNLTLLCDGHHNLLHDGVLAIRGRAPDQLAFELPLSYRGNREDPPDDTPASTPS